MKENDGGGALVMGLAVGVGAIGLLFITGFMVAGILLKAFVLVKLWGWFLVPCFGLEALTYPLAVGLATIVGFTTHQIPMQHCFNDDDVKNKHRVTYILTALLWPFLTLLIGWVAQLFI